MTVYELYQILDGMYPRSLSCPWDNDGIMVCGDLSAEVRRVMLALDASQAALDAAVREECQVLLTHHPLLFRPLRSLVPDHLSGARTLTALCGGVAVLSFHTRLDAGDGGVNDALACRLGLAVCGKFGDEESPELGRLAELPAPMTAEDFAKQVKEALGADGVAVTGNVPVKRVALVGGDGKGFISAAKAAGADTLVTGAAGYNAALDAAEMGMNIIEAGHYHTEAPVLDTLSRICRESCGAECLFFDSNRTRFL